MTYCLHGKFLNEDKILSKHHVRHAKSNEKKENAKMTDARCIAYYDCKLLKTFHSIRKKSIQDTEFPENPEKKHYLNSDIMIQLFKRGRCVIHRFYLVMRN